MTQANEQGENPLHQKLAKLIASELQQFDHDLNKVQQLLDKLASLLASPGLAPVNKPDSTPEPKAINPSFNNVLVPPNTDSSKLNMRNSNPVQLNTPTVVKGNPTTDRPLTTIPSTIGTYAPISPSNKGDKRKPVRVYGDVDLSHYDEYDRRKKRSWFPFLGTLANKIAGVVTESQLNQVKDKVNEMATSLDRVVHVLNGSLSVLATTQEEVGQHRQVINHLVDTVNKLNMKAQQFDTRLQQVHQEVMYAELVIEIQGIFTLIRNTMNEISTALAELGEQLNLSMTGNLSPSLIPPEKLMSILNSVDRQLPKTLSLPYAIKKNTLMKYYQQLNVALLPDKLSFHIIMPIPLLLIRSIYDLYSTTQVPVPHSTGSSAIVYNLEAKYLALSLSRDHYLLLDDKDIMACQKSDFMYCPLCLPSYSSDNAPSCMSSLFMQEPKLIKNLCKTTIVNMTQVPYLVNIFDGTWMIATLNELDIDLACTFTPPFTSNYS